MGTRTSTSTKIVNEILDKGLASSTWSDTFPDAYKQLLLIREDIEISVRDVLIKDRKNLISNLESI